MQDCHGWNVSGDTRDTASGQTYSGKYKLQPHFHTAYEGSYYMVLSLAKNSSQTFRK